MPAKIHVTGAAHVYVGHKALLAADGPSSGVYLGTCEKSPQFSTEFKWGDIQNDIAGGAPIDLIFKGMTSKLQFLLTRFNDVHIQNFVGNSNSRNNRVLPAHQPGIMDGGQIGALSEYSHAAVVSAGHWLAVKFEFAEGTAADSYLPKGYFFPSVNASEYGYDEGSLGTNAKKVKLGIEAHASVMAPGVSGTRGMTAGDYVLRLYTTNPDIFAFGSLPAID